MTIERMKRWVIAMLLCGLCHTAAFALQYDRNSQTQAWGYQPVYKSNSSMPNYRFQSTSVLIPTQDQSESAACMPGNSRPRRVDGWSDEEDPIGTVPDPAPIGECPWGFILLLAAAYSAFRYRKKSLT